MPLTRNGGNIDSHEYPRTELGVPFGTTRSNHYHYSGLLEMDLVLEMMLWP
jgi:hypothetical protein